MYANANDANHNEKILPKLIGIKKSITIKVPLVISKTKGTFFSKHSCKIKFLKPTGRPDGALKLKYYVFLQTFRSYGADLVPSGRPVCSRKIIIHIE